MRGISRIRSRISLLTSKSYRRSNRGAIWASTHSLLSIRGSSNQCCCPKRWNRNYMVLIFAIFIRLQKSRRKTRRRSDAIQRTPCPMSIAPIDRKRLPRIMAWNSRQDPRTTRRAVVMTWMSPTSTTCTPVVRIQRSKSSTRTKEARRWIRPVTEIISKLNISLWERAR